MSKTKKLNFSIQQHDARKMHYDLRLEIEGKLKSWAVPKGPSTNPAEKRLAIETEDHEMSYLDFEGEIKEGYGKGKVLLWDKGTYENLKSEDIFTSYKNGQLEVFFNGKKIKGGFALVKMKNRDKQWLLVKMSDKEANGRHNPVNTEKKSVKSGKTITEI